LRYSSKTKK